MKRILLALGLFLSLASPSWAQNTTCSDRPSTDSSNACANTRFVHTAISGSGINYCTTADRTGATDSTAAIQTCINTSNNVFLQFGIYKITDELTLHSDLTFGGDPGTTIRQFTRNKKTLTGLNLSNVEINDIILYGEGNYCGNLAQPVTTNPAITPYCPTGPVLSFTNDIGIELTKCSNCRINRVHTKNYGAAGMFLTGGDYVIDSPFIEGTNGYASPVILEGNYQDGIAFANDPTNGATNAKVVSPTITGTAQGITGGNLNGPTGSVLVTNYRAYNIPGQHAVYTSFAGMVFHGVTCNNIALACIKGQISGGHDAYNFTATGVVADTIGGNMFEIGVIGGIGFHNIQLAGIGNAVGRGLSVGGPITNLTANIQVQDTVGEAIVYQGAGMKDHWVLLDSTRAALDCVLVTATTSSNINITPTCRESNTSNTGRFGVIVASASAGIILNNPVISDANTRMVNGLINTTLGSTVQVIGLANISGASGTCVSATGLITAWPIWLTLSCGGGNYTGPTNITPVTVGSIAVPFTDNMFFSSPSTLTFGNNDVVFSINNGIGISGLGNGITIDGQLKPNSLGIDLGNAVTSWAGLYLSGVTSGTGRLLPPAIAGSAVWTLPTATTTLVGRDTTDTFTNKSISGSTNTLTNIANASLTNSSTTVNGQVCTLGSSCTVTASAGTVTVGTTTVASGTTTRVLFNNAGVLGEYTISGSGSVAMSTSAALTTPAITGGTIGALTSFGIRSTGSGAFDLQLANTENLTGNKALTIRLFDTARTMSIGGTISFGTDFTTGSNPITLTTTGSTNVTLPTTGTLATLAGTEEFTNKTLNASVGKGTWTASGTWTLPAFTAGGTISGGGNQLNNIVIGTTTPLAGTFTTLGSGAHTITSSSATSLAVGLNGATNPAFQVDSSTASQAAGLKVTGGLAGGGVNVAVISSGTNEDISFNAKGSGVVFFASASTGGADFGLGGGLTNVRAAFKVTSAAVDLTALAADTATVDNTVCVSGTGRLLKGSGANGICLGTSSRQFKHDVTTMGSGLAEIVRLTPRNFWYNKGFGDGGLRKQYGFIAEEVVKVIPGVTAPDVKGNPQSVDMLAMVPIIVNAIKQLKADNDNIRMDVLALQAKKVNAK